MQHSSFGQQTGQIYAQMQDAPAADQKRSDLAEMMYTICQINGVTSDLHLIADRAVGVSGVGENGTKPQALPAGMVGDINEALYDLYARLNALHGRLIRIA